MYRLIIRLATEYGFLISLICILIYFLVGHIRMSNMKSHDTYEYQGVHTIIGVTYNNFGLPFSSNHIAQVTIVCDREDKCNIIITTLSR